MYCDYVELDQQIRLPQNYLSFCLALLILFSHIPLSLNRGRLLIFFHCCFIFIFFVERRANGINILEPLKWILSIYIELRIHGHEVDEPPSKTAGWRSEFTMENTEELSGV